MEQPDAHRKIFIASRKCSRVSPVRCPPKSGVPAVEHLIAARRASLLTGRCTRKAVFNAATSTLLRAPSAPTNTLQSAIRASMCILISA